MEVVEFCYVVAYLNYAVRGKLKIFTHTICPTLKYGFAPVICFGFLESDTFFDVVKDVTIGRFLLRFINVL